MLRWQSVLNVFSYNFAGKIVVFFKFVYVFYTTDFTTFSVFLNSKDKAKVLTRYCFVTVRYHRYLGCEQNDTLINYNVSITFCIWSFKRFVATFYHLYTSETYVFRGVYS